MWCHIHDKLQTPLWDHTGLRSGCSGGDSLTGCCGNNIDKVVRLKREVLKMILIQILKVLMTLSPHVRDIQLGQIQSASLLHGMTTDLIMGIRSIG